MPRELEKRTPGGERYVRPPEIETAIDVALQEDLATRVRRAHVRDRASSDYLRTECLVHLVREAIRVDDAPAQEKLIPILFLRCEAILISKVPDSMQRAEEIRSEVLGRLSELIAEDAEDRTRGVLDFYETRFGLAFKRLRLTVERAFRRRARERSTDDPRQYVEEPATTSTLEDLVFDQQRLATLDLLPDDERSALVLHYLNGLDIESVDPTKHTVATALGVTGRTVRNLLARARAKLIALEEKP